MHWVLITLLTNSLIPMSLPQQVLLSNNTLDDLNDKIQTHRQPKYLNYPNHYEISNNNESLKADLTESNKNITVNKGNEGTHGRDPTRENTGIELSFVVQTTHGPVQGYSYNMSSDLTAFYDIPYGKVDGPFEAPKEPDIWEEAKQITKHQKVCPQLNENETFIGDLDCLSLSIFIPNNASNASVLFHIHDGNFKDGSGNPDKYGPEHLVSRGVILVLPNYRLGALGFLCLGREEAPGNAALKDLTRALNWIVNNIEAFGGNPADIVVSGEGSSGILVSYLALSPMSSVYFSKAITESGAVLSYEALDRDPLSTVLKLLEALGHNNVTHDINSLDQVAINDLVLFSKDIRFRPCVENSSEPFLNETPWNLMKDADIDKVFMVGSASHAGMQDLLAMTPESISEINNDFSRLLPNDLMFDSEAEINDAMDKLRTQYFKDANITMDEIESLCLYLSDALYLSPGLRAARTLVASGATVYIYEFSFLGQLNRASLALPIQPDAGAVRGDIAGYIFTQNGEMPAAGSAEERMINIMTDLWVSFARTGQPSSDNVTWSELQQVDEADEAWLSIGSEVSARRGLHPHRLSLWSRLYREHFVENSATTVQCYHYPVVIGCIVLMARIL